MLLKEEHVTRALMETHPEQEMTFGGRRELIARRVSLPSRVGFADGSSQEAPLRLDHDVSAAIELKASGE
ncbi:MAG: hypothetical protein ABR865_16070 [Terracidiphilus sp.]|jgi:hypothetical protein